MDWTAEWIEDGECEHKPYRVRNTEKWKKFKCSKCGYKAGRRTSQKYCPNCGRAMTPEARAELEKRELDHFPDTTKMVPLTQEQLWEMDGKSAYLPQTNCWVLITKNSFVPLFTFPDGDQCNAVEWYEEVGPAYVYPPTQIDRGTWVSVKDRMPNIGKNVLVFAKAKYSEWWQYTLDRLEEGENKPVWIFTHGWFEVTHWMPLPEAPSEIKK